MEYQEDLLASDGRLEQQLFQLVGCVDVHGRLNVSTLKFVWKAAIDNK